MSQRNLRRPAALIGAAVLAAGALTACTSQGGGGDGAAGGSKESLTIAIEQDIPGWDPGKLLPGSVGMAAHAVYDRVVTCDEVGNIEGNVAESFEFNDDNTELTFEIREGQTFSDGSPVDGSAVQKSLAYTLASPGGQGFLPGVEATLEDEMTVKLTAPSPQPLMAFYMCGNAGTVASPKYLESGKLDQAPVGSGPYVYDRQASTPGSDYVYTKNEDNWNADAFPYETVTLKVLPDRTARVNALRSGQVDGAVTDASTMRELEAAGLDHITMQGRWAGLLLEDRDGEIIPALGDPRVRQAINMVFDKEAIAEKLYQGEAQPTAQIFREGSAAWIEDLEDPYPYDVEAARDLMAEAGYADGFSVEIPFIAGFGLDAAMPLVIQGLKELNIEAKQVTLTGSNALLDLLSGKYPIIFWPLGNQGDSRADIEADVAPGGVWNTSKVSDPAIDELLETMRTAQGEESTEAQQEINRFVIDEAWFAPWVYVNDIFSFNPEVVELEESTDSNQLAPNLIDFK